MKKIFILLTLTLSLTLFLFGCSNLPTTSTTYTLGCKIDKNAPKVEIYQLSSIPINTMSDKKLIKYVTENGILIASFIPNGQDNIIQNIPLNKNEYFSVITYPKGIATLGETSNYHSSEYLHVTSDGATSVSSFF